MNKPYILCFSKRCKLSVASLQQLCKSQICPRIKLINVVPVSEFRKQFPSLASQIKNVPTLIDTEVGEKFEGFQVLNWIKDKTKELGGSIEEDAPFLPGMVELVEGEVGKGIVSDTYSYITEISDELSTSDVGMKIGHSYAGFDDAYSGPPSVDRPPAPDARKPIGGMSGGNNTKTAKQMESDRRMEELLARRNAEVPQPPTRIGGSSMPHPSMMRRPGMR